MASSISTGPALNSLAYYQQQLNTVSNQASSGKRLINASIDPSGAAIYNALIQQSQGADTANQNISQASDAINVAQGAASGIGDALSKLHSLAIEAGNGFNSASAAPRCRRRPISWSSRSTPMPRRSTSTAPHC